MVNVYRQRTAKNQLPEGIYKTNCNSGSQGLDEKRCKIWTATLHPLLVEDQHHEGGHHCQAHRRLLLASHMLELPEKGVQVKI